MNGQGRCRINIYDNLAINRRKSCHLGLESAIPSEIMRERQNKIMRERNIESSYLYVQFSFFCLTYVEPKHGSN